ncbi:MAG: O-methyltransferase [Flammeovirgaceae bacterium]|nr:O-methyltransferase [Flammeovirgaceae bacterium]
MEFIDPQLQAYAEAHTSPEPKVLSDLNRHTQANVLMPRMLSGHLQGRFLSFISHMIRPRRVLEVGTYTGYSAICLAEGLANDGLVITIDNNEELTRTVTTAIASAGLECSIKCMIGNAQEIIPSLHEKFDLVFIDADKENYSLYFEMVIDKVHSGGFILADNVLWSGKVLQPKPDKDTQGILAFNAKVQADDRVENVLLPVRDGIMIIRKK